MKKAAGRLGYDIHRRDLSHPARRAAAMRSRGIDLVLDVGANVGQYVSWLRQFGYAGQVVSFEPIPAVYAELERNLRGDAKWAGRRTALGAESTTANINVSASSLLSSMLETRTELSARIAAASVSEVVEVPVVTLDEIWDEIVPASARVMLKIDVQGFEHSVLDGVARHLPQVHLLEIEMGLERLYEDGSSIYDLLPRISDSGFGVISIDSGYVDRDSGQVLDIDLLAGRPTSA